MFRSECNAPLPVGPVTAKVCVLAISRASGNPGGVRRVGGELLTLRRSSWPLVPAKVAALATASGAISFTKCSFCLKSDRMKAPFPRPCRPWPICTASRSLGLVVQVDEQGIELGQPADQPAMAEEAVLGQVDIGFARELPDRIGKVGDRHRLPRASRNEAGGQG